MIEKIKEHLLSPKLGISTFVQCVLPNESGRIVATKIDTMNRLLLTLTSLYQEYLSDETQIADTNWAKLKQSLIENEDI